MKSDLLFHLPRRMPRALARSMSVDIPAAPPRQAYLDSNEIVKWRLAEPAESEFKARITMVTMNLLDPFVACFLGSSKLLSSINRYTKIAECMSNAQVPLMAFQEANRRSAAVMQARGYEVIGSDVHIGMKPQLKMIDDSDLSHVPCTMSRWTGVQIAYDPRLYQLVEPEPRFEIYPPQHQKQWAHVFASSYSLLSTLLCHPCDFRKIKLAAMQFVESLSGPFRMDGVLIARLQHAITQERLILCTTHIESFNRSIGWRQLQNLADRIEQIAQEYPGEDIAIAGDFNWHIACGQSVDDLEYESVAHFLRRRLGAITMPTSSMGYTLIKNGKTIDGIFYVPSAHPKSKVRGMMLWPGSSDRQAELSDHCAVITQLGSVGYQ